MILVVVRKTVGSRSGRISKQPYHLTDHSKLDNFGFPSKPNTAYNQGCYQYIAPYSIVNLSYQFVHSAAKIQKRGLLNVIAKVMKIEGNAKINPFNFNNKWQIGTQSVYFDVPFLCVVLNFATYGIFYG